MSGQPALVLACLFALGAIIPDGAEQPADRTSQAEGAIAGRIFDEGGEPLAGVQVEAIACDQQRCHGTQAAQTNDAGEFRLAYLRPDDYFVVAGLPMQLWERNDERSGYASTFYPGVVELADARRFRIDAGQVISDIAFSLVPVRTVRIRGAVRWSDGRPLSDGFVQLEPRAPSADGYRSLAVDCQGRFVLWNVAPGDFTLYASDNAVAIAESSAGWREIHVDSADMDDVDVTIGRPAIVSGRITIDGDRPAFPPDAQVVATPLNPWDPAESCIAVGTVGPRWTFAFQVGPCVSRLEVNAGNDLWTVAVRLKGSDVTDTGIAFDRDGQVDGLEISLTRHPTELSGIILRSAGERGEATVVVFSRDPRRWRLGARYVQVRVVRNGSYRIEGLPAGSYYAIAVDHVEHGRWNDPEYLDRIKVNATSVTLADAETKTLDLKLVSGS